jgi:hypothetical protein
VLQDACARDVIFGTVHAVVANAAVNHASLAVSTSDEAWQEVIIRT